MRIRLPATMRQAGTPGTIELELPSAGTLRAVIEELEKALPGAGARLIAADGTLHRYVNLYVNGEDIRQASGLDTAVSDDDELLILAAVSGG